MNTKLYYIPTYTIEREFKKKNEILHGYYLDISKQLRYMFHGKDTNLSIYRTYTPCIFTLQRFLCAKMFAEIFQDKSTTKFFLLKSFYNIAYTYIHHRQQRCCPAICYLLSAVCCLRLRLCLCLSIFWRAERRLLWWWRRSIRLHNFR